MALTILLFQFLEEDLQEVLREVSEELQLQLPKTPRIPWGVRQEKICERWHEARGSLFVAAVEQSVPPEAEMCHMCHSDAGIIRYLLLISSITK